MVARGSRCGVGDGAVTAVRLCWELLALGLRLRGFPQSQDQCTVGGCRYERPELKGCTSGDRNCPIFSERGTSVEGTSEGPR